MKLSEAIKVHIAAKRAEGRANGTVSNYRLVLRDLLAFVGDCDLRAVTPDTLDAWLIDLRIRIKPRTVWLWTTIARAFFTHMVQRGVIAASPLVTKPPRVQEEPLRNVALKDWEVAAILEAAENDLREYVAVRFLFDTGCRASAIGTVAIDGLDLGNRTARAIEKGGREVILDYSKDTASLLRKWLRQRGELEHDCVFVSPRGLPMSKSVLWRMLRRLADEAGVENARPHKWRHTVGRKFALAGAPLTVIQAKLNHASPQMTARYLNQTRADVRGFTEKLRDL